MDFRIWKWRYQSKSTITLNFLSDILSKLDAMSDDINDLADRIDKIEKLETEDNSDTIEALKTAQDELKEKNRFVEGLLVSMIDRRFSSSPAQSNGSGENTRSLSVKEYMARKNSSSPRLP